MVASRSYPFHFDLHISLNQSSFVFCEFFLKHRMLKDKLNLVNMHL